VVRVRTHWLPGIRQSIADWSDNIVNLSCRQSGSKPAPTACQKTLNFAKLRYYRNFATKGETAGKSSGKLARVLLNSNSFASLVVPETVKMMW
jgi:hypothetical protein